MGSLPQEHCYRRRGGRGQLLGKNKKTKMALSKSNVKIKSVMRGNMVSNKLNYDGKGSN